MEKDLILQQQKEQEETYDRITAPMHLTQNWFSEHQKVEGFFENRNVENFFASDRLLKLDSRFGTIQMGYDPKREQSFLFANIKTSIYDTADSSHERKLEEENSLKQQKTGNQNQAYNARRQADSATILYKYENKPWSHASIGPYYNRMHMGAFRKTMPFLSTREEAQQHEQNRAQASEAQETIRTGLAKGDLQAVQGARAAQVALKTADETTAAIAYHKQAQARWFFRKVNLAFDTQKQEMFQYYRTNRRKKEDVAEQATVQPTEDEDS